MGDETIIFNIVQRNEIGLMSNPDVFNAIPIGRYRKCCGLSTIYLKTTSQRGIVLDYLMMDGSHAFSTVEYEDESFSIDITDGEMLFVRSCDDSSLEGYVYVKDCKLRDISIGHVVCTFHREVQVTEKIEALSELKLPGYRLYVIDNGCTLDPIDEPDLTVVHSPNLGGSGGFANGMIHSLEDGCDYIILNDDDAIVTKESVFRFIMFLKMIEQDYYDHCFAGVMMDFNHPDVVYEAGAAVMDGRLIPRKNGLDLSCSDNLSELILDERIDYSNWTFACFPSRVVREHGFPLPLFVREDDVEYGIRVNGPIMIFPGLYVWHPTYVDSFSTSNYYYYARNRMAALACNGKLDGAFIDKLFREMAVEVSAYRYGCCEEMMFGVYDFLSGPEYLFNLCRGDRHHSKMPALFELDLLRNQIRVTGYRPRRGFALRKWTLNGVFFPSVGDIETTPFDVDSADFYRIGKVLYRVGDKGFIAKRNRSKAVVMAVRVSLLKWRTKKEVNRVAIEYKESMPKYSSIGFWREMLDSN